MAGRGQCHYLADYLEALRLSEAPPDNRDRRAPLNMPTFERSLGNYEALTEPVSVTETEGRTTSSPSCKFYGIIPHGRVCGHCPNCPSGIILEDSDEEDEVSRRRARKVASHPVLIKPESQVKQEQPAPPPPPPNRSARKGRYKDRYQR